MKLFKYGVYALCASAMLSISSCFNLDEEPYSEIIEEDYVPTEADEIALFGYHLFTITLCDGLVWLV